MMSPEPIHFLILYRFHEHLVPSGVDFARIWKLKHISGNRFSMPESAKGKEQVLHWLIDGHGKLRKASVAGYANEWLRPLGWLFRFTRTIYEIQPGRVATIGELTDLCANASTDREKSSAGAFCKFLATHPPETPFTKEMFLKCMHEPPGGNHPTHP